jgi:hypothetical protein
MWVVLVVGAWAPAEEEEEEEEEKNKKHDKKKKKKKKTAMTMTGNSELVDQQVLPAEKYCAAG